MIYIIGTATLIIVLSNVPFYYTSYYMCMVLPLLHIICVCVYRMLLYSIWYMCVCYYQFYTVLYMCMLLPVQSCLYCNIYYIRACVSYYSVLEHVRYCVIHNLSFKIPYSYHQVLFCTRYNIYPNKPTSTSTSTSTCLSPILISLA